tara:strand:- start:1948 stop:2163 length:216 start_codon:yes stop_codon:yes gene_type:complete
MIPGWIPVTLTQLSHFDGTPIGRNLLHQSSWTRRSQIAISGVLFYTSRTAAATSDLPVRADGASAEKQPAL